VTAAPEFAVTFTVNGEPHPATACSWYEVAPCGCTCGVTVAESVYGGRVKLTAEDAWREFYSDRPGNREHERRARAAGFRMELGLRADVQTRLVANCPHTPEWGVEKVTLDGHVWAGLTGSTRSHLVPGSTGRDDRYVLGDAVSLASTPPLLAACAKPGRYWSTH